MAHRAAATQHSKSGRSLHLRESMPSGHSFACGHPARTSAPPSFAHVTRCLVYIPRWLRAGFLAKRFCRIRDMFPHVCVVCESSRPCRREETPGPTLLQSRWGAHASNARSAEAVGAPPLKPRRPPVVRKLDLGAAQRAPQEAPRAWRGVRAGAREVDRETRVIGSSLAEECEIRGTGAGCSIIIVTRCMCPAQSSIRAHQALQQHVRVVHSMVEM